MTARRITIAASAAALALAAVFATSPSIAAAQTLPASVAATHSVPATGTGYDLDFTLPTAAKAGCGVCHSDPGLVRLVDGKLYTFYIDPADSAASAHAGVQCGGCHAGFASTTPHDDVPREWRTEAKSVCKNCHKDQFISYGRGAHRLEVKPGAAPRDSDRVQPLCGDCHGSHAIGSFTDDSDGQNAIHRRGWEVCGRCHEDYWDSYSDYYHGAAYKRGALDAPACWDCHGWHDILPSSDPDSRVSVRHLPETCGQCHEDSSEAFLSYASLVHRSQDVSERVFLYRVLKRIQGFFSGLFG